jgi:hypothetical protein
MSMNGDEMGTMAHKIARKFNRPDPAAILVFERACRGEKLTDVEAQYLVDYPEFFRQHKCLYECSQTLKGIIVRMKADGRIDAKGNLVGA